MAPAILIRLTKALAIVAAFAVLPSAQAACGPAVGRAASHERRATIALQDLPTQGPVFYWHDSSTYALLYFRPEDLVARLKTLSATEPGSNRDSIFGNASLVPALLDNIQVDLPLKESTDLFRYSLIDSRFDAVVNHVLAGLMQEGKVMLDQWMHEEHPERSIVMVSRTGAHGEDAGRWFCTPANDVLFRVGPGWP